MPMMIVFDKLTYTPGSVVSGHVIIVKKAPEKVKGLTMRFIGRSSKLMSESDSVKNYKKEVYFDEKVDIFGHDGTNTLLKIGETLFPFTFNLPPGLPSSFIWNTGNILYFVEAKLTRSSWKDDKRVSTRIQVEGIFDLNLDPMAYLPTEIKRHRYVQHLLSKSGPYGFTFRIGRNGFVRGHTIPFSVEIKNLSKLDAKKLKISLLQEINQEGKTTSLVVEQVKGPAVSSGEIQTWEARMKIPATIPPTNLGNVLHFPVVLSLQYALHIELSLKSATVDSLCAKVPVTIGTLPLLRNRDRQRLSQLQMLQGSLYNHHHNESSPPPHFLHDHDCPLSQVIVPVAANTNSQSPSQFSPNSTLIPPGISVHSSVFVSHNHDGRRNLNVHPHLLPNSLILPRYDFYGGRDENSAFRIHRTGPGRSRTRNHRVIRESPPPPYEDVVSNLQQDTTVILSGITKANNTRNSQEDESSSPSPNNNDNDDSSDSNNQQHGEASTSSSPTSETEDRHSCVAPGPSTEKRPITSPQQPITNSSSKPDNHLPCYSSDEEESIDEEVQEILRQSSNSKAQSSETTPQPSQSSLVMCTS